MTSSKIGACLFLSFIFNNTVISQITISGTIIDNEQNPVNNALVEIIDDTDTLNYYSTYSDESGEFLITNILTDVVKSKRIPQKNLIITNYPNPFNPATNIYYELPRDGDISIWIFDILGREVRKLEEGFRKEGIYQAYWNGRNNWNTPVSAGIYFCYIKCRNNFAVHKMVLLDGGSTAISTSSRLKNLQKQFDQMEQQIFNFSVRVSGNEILFSEFSNLSCSGDTSLALNVSKMLQSKTVGAEGGIIEIDGFRLSIPSGSFSESVELQLGIDVNATDQVDDGLSNVYRIDGLPSRFSKPIKFYIKYQNDGNADSISVGIGKIKTDLILKDPFIAFAGYNAVDSAGYAVIELNDTNMSLLKTDKINNSRSLNYAVVLLSGGKIKSSDGNFYFHFPKSLAEFIPDLDTYTGEAIIKYTTLGFNKKANGIYIQQYWPLDIKIRELKTNSYVILDYKGYKPILLVNRKYVNIQSLPVLKYELQKAIYFCFVLQDHNKEEMNSSEHFWLHFAIYSYLEHIFNEDPNLIPAVFKKLSSFPLNYKRILYGLNYNASIFSNGYEHGASLIPLLYYLTHDAQYSNPILSTLYNNLEDGVTALQSIVKSLNSKEYIWWEKFINKYLNGEIYNLSADVFTEDLLNSFILDINSSFTEKTFSLDYENISANLYRININSGAYNESARLRFTLDAHGTNYEYVNLHIWGIKDNKLYKLTAGTDVFLNYKINELIQNGYNSLLLCVSNSFSEPPYTNKININLKVKLVEEETYFKKCVLTFRIAGEYSNNDGTSDLNANAYWEFNRGVYIDGDFFSAVWDTGYVSTEYEGIESHWDHYKYISGNIDLSTMTVTNLYAEMYNLEYSTLVSEFINGFIRNETTTSIRLIDFPVEKYSSGEGWFSCKVIGTEIDLSKLIVNDRIDSENSIIGEKGWLELNQTKESDENLINILFYK